MELGGEVGPEFLDEFFVLTVFAVDELMLEGRPLLKFLC